MAAAKPNADTTKTLAKKTRRFRKLTLVLAGAILFSGTSASLALYLKPRACFSQRGGCFGFGCCLHRRAHDKSEKKRSEVDPTAYKGGCDG